MAAEIVLDASVAAKCFITEAGSDLARRLVGSDAVLIAPEFLFVELASVAAKRVRRGDIPRELGAMMVEQAPGLLDQAYPAQPYASRAFELAASAGLSAYDGLYLALAEARNAIVVTSDARLVQKASDAGIGRCVMNLATFTGREDS